MRLLAVPALAAALVSCRAAPPPPEAPESPRPATTPATGTGIPGAPTSQAIEEARLRLLAGDPAGALSRLDRESWGPDILAKARALSLRADALDRLGRRVEAAASLKAALALDPDSPSRGEILDRFRDLAIRHATDPPRRFLGLVPLSSPRDEAAGWLWEIVLREDQTPRGARCRFEIAEIYRRAGDLAEAEIRYGEVIRDNPDSPEAAEALFWRGKCLVALWPGPEYGGTILGQAREAFEDYLGMNPDGTRAADCRQTLREIEERERERKERIRASYERWRRIQGEEGGAPPPDPPLQDAGPALP